MSVLSDVRTYLLADATLGGLVGSRVYPLILPQSPTMPAVTVSVVSGDRHHSTDGPSGLATPRVQVDCWGSTYSSANDVFEAVRKRLDGVTNGSIQVAFADNELDFYDSEVDLFRKVLDFLVWFNETTS